MEENMRVNLLREMLYIRMVEEAISDEYSGQEMRCPVHLSIGQESVPVGVSAHLGPDDHVISAHRSHAHYLAKGGSLKAMLGELYGKDTGCAEGKGGSMHLIDIDANVTAAVPIVGSSISIGTGVGFGLHLQKSDAISVVYFGDGATEEGVFAESLNFAALHNLPVLFVCENNFYSVYSNLQVRQPANRSLEKISEGHGVSYLSCDGNNVSKVEKISSKVIEKIKSGSGPSLLEFDTYRWLEHCGPNWDDELGYRPSGELDNWKLRCPIASYEAELLESNNITQEKIDGLRLEIAAIIEDAFDHAKSAKFPSTDKLLQHVYAD